MYKETIKSSELQKPRYCSVLLAMVALLAIMIFSATESSMANETAQANSQSTSASTEAASKDANKDASKDALSGYISGESLFPSFLKITLSLFAVIAAIYLTLTLLKKAMGRKISNSSAANAIEVLETCYLAPKRSVTLVRIGSRSALLSVSDTAIGKLLELDSDETKEIAESLKSNASAPDFRQSLTKAKQKIIDLSSLAMKNREQSKVNQAAMK